MDISKPSGTFTGVWFSTADVRQLLKEALNNEELDELVFDRFRSVYQMFTVDMSHLKKIHLLLEYCERHGLVERLIVLIKQLNPHQYYAHLQKLQENLSSITLEIKLDGSFSDMKTEQLNAIVTTLVGTLAVELNLSEKEIVVKEVRLSSLVLKLEIPPGAVSALAESFPKESWSVLLQKAVEVIQVHILDNPEIASAILKIIVTNISHNRFTQFALYWSSLTPIEAFELYIKNVVTIYNEQHKYVNKVFNGDSEVWESLYVKMQRWAYHFLLRNQLSPSQETFDLAVTFAGEAGAILINARYPYDIEAFDTWAIELVKNVCRKNLKKETNQSLRIGSESDFSDFIDSIAALEDSFAFKQALPMLPEREQKVLNLYMQGNTSLEIAEILDILPSNVYLIKHQAISRLRKLLALREN